MPATKITDLLPIPDGTRQPHPYQVLGLEDGEQDPAVIASALQLTVSRLNAAKPETDPSLWKQAARLVKGAQEVLADPDQKAKLDARFGIVSVDTIAAATQSSPADAFAAFLPSADPLTPAVDPLAAVLPKANPLAPASPSSPQEPTVEVGSSPSPLASVPQPPGPQPPVPQPALMSDSVPVNAMPPGLFGTPATTNEPDPSVPSIGVVVNAPRARRKQSMAGTMLFWAFAFGTFGVIGALAYLLIFGPGQVSITQADGTLSISTQPAATGTTTIVAQPRPVSPARETSPRDPIMGNLGASDSRTRSTREPSGLTSSPFNDFDSDLDSDPTMPLPEMASVDAPNLPPTEMSDAMGVTEPGMEPMTDEMIAEAEGTLDRVRTLIRTANWQEMKPAAEAALEQRMSEDQLNEAQSLFELADLATYYRGGIEKAVADLQVGNDFEVTEDFRVIVVETGPDRLVIRFNTKNRSYTFDQLPWSLAHKLATFTLPNDPSAQAAKAVYQAISPNANADYRDEALKWLADMQGEVEGADPQQLSETIRSLFVES